MSEARGSAADIAAVAAVVQRLAVLLEAGVTPRNAWTYLAEPPGSARAGRSGGARSGEVRSGEERSGEARSGRLPEDPVGASPHARSPTRTPADRQLTVVQTIARAVNLGVSGDQAIDAACRVCGARTARAWRAVAAVWLVAEASGAPIAACLREVAGALREIGDNQRTIDVALAAPVATARLMTVLPLAALGFGAILGFDTVHTLTATGPGLFCALAGGGLLLLSRAWNARLVRSATPPTVMTGLAAELMAVAMAGGASVTGAQHLTERALETFGLLEPRGMHQVAGIVELSERAGVPAAELLRSEGSQLRREASAAGQKVTAALSVKLMLPLGLCVLPAFMLLGVAPLLLAVLSSTFGSW